MSTKIFVNLSVKDLAASTAFFEALGYEFNPNFSDENAGCLVISEDIYAMLLTEPFFKTFTSKELVDATKATEAIIAISADSKAEVDGLVEAAFTAGATTAEETQDLGFMYSRSFYDLDGHHWEVFWMSEEAAQSGPPAAEA